MHMSVFAIEIKSETDLMKTEIKFKFNFNTETDSNTDKINDDTINWNMFRANGYLTMAIFGIIIAAVLGPGSGVGVFIAVVRPFGSEWYHAFLFILLAFGGVLLALLTAAIFIAVGIIMAVTGFNLYQKYKKSKQPDPFIKFDDEKKALNMGLKIRI